MPPRLKILLLAQETSWVSPARLPQALRVAGFEVGVACRARAILARTKYWDHFFLLPEKRHGRALLAALRTISSAWLPDLILPMDDQTALFLARAHEQLTAAAEPGTLLALLRRSLGNPASVREALSKRKTLETARALGIQIPAQRTVAALPEILEFGRQHGFPVVLKRSFDNGGNGVFVCADESEATRVFRILQIEKTGLTRLKVWREQFRGRLMESSWLPKDESLTVSQFIPGKCANSLAAALDGKMAGILTSEVEQTYMGGNGPASVVRLVHNQEMSRISRLLLEHWGLTGLIGFDFILDATGQPWLLECNPRATALAHLGARVGMDLCVALYQGFQGLASGHSPAQSMTRELLVAHFPQEKWRAPASPYFELAFHDVPLDDDSLLEILEKCPVPQPAKV